jgi:hypothetical protein
LGGPPATLNATTQIKIYASTANKLVISRSSSP